MHWYLLVGGVNFGVMNAFEKVCECPYIWYGIGGLSDLLGVDTSAETASICVWSANRKMVWQSVPFWSLELGFCLSAHLSSILMYLCF